MLSICKDCASGYVLPGEPQGTTIENGTYFYSPTGRMAGSAQDKVEGGPALVFLTDIFGLPLVNSKILADSFAERLKCDVFVPDLFNGNPPLAESNLAPYIVDEAGQKLSLWNNVKFISWWVRAIPSLAFNRPGVGLARAEQCILNVREKGYTKVAVVGYCFGGGIALQIATKKGLADVVVACHPGPANVSDMAKVVTPLLIVCADDDVWVPPAKRDQLQAALKTNTGTPSKMVTYPGTTHGFAARPNLGIPKIKEGFEGAFDEAGGWFEKYL